MFTTCRLGILMNTNKENGAQVILNKDTFVIRNLIVIYIETSANHLGIMQPCLCFELSVYIVYVINRDGILICLKIPAFQTNFKVDMYCLPAW